MKKLLCLTLAAGALFSCAFKNDLDYPVARALAARLISVPPYALPDISVLEEAKKIMKQCGAVICRTKVFGEGNRANQELLAFARERGLCKEPGAVPR